MILLLKKKTIQIKLKYLTILSLVQICDLVFFFWKKQQRQLKLNYIIVLNLVQICDLFFLFWKKNN